jgi:hypothetical protein
MTEQEQVQVTQADRDAVQSLRGGSAYTLGFYDHTPLVQAFARHRHTTTAEALEAMREAREALEALRQIANDAHADLEGIQDFARAAIAKIEGEQP